MANENNVSRQLLYRDKQKVLDVIYDSFEPSSKPHDVLFHLPVTKDWLDQFSLCLELHCNGSARGIKTCANDLLDYNLALGSKSRSAM